MKICSRLLKATISLIALVLMSSLPAFSQLVNIEKQRKEIKPGWQGAVDFALNLNQNTKSIVQFSNTINTQYTYKAHTLLVLNDISILKVSYGDQSEDLINKSFQHIRYNYTFRDSSAFTYEIFAQRQHNKIKYIKLRFISGTGFRIRLINTKSVRFYLAPLFMYEYEKLNDSAGTVTRMIKGDFYVSGTVQLNDKLYFSHVTYYQPALMDLGSTITFEPVRDFRLSSESSLTMELIKDFLEFSINFELNYDSRPPQELRDYPLFYNFKNKLTFKF